MTDTQQAPTDHPQPNIWWRHIRWQSWIAMVAMCVQSPALIRWGIPDAATAPLVVLNIGLVAVASTYSGGSTLIDAIRAWQCTDSGS